MDKAKDLLQPLIGNLVWNVRGGDGSFVTMEFGAPHLRIREPIVPVHSTSERVRRRLQQRHVIVMGEWHLWIRFAEWQLSTASGYIDSAYYANFPSHDMFLDLDGQRLSEVAIGDDRSSLILRFDLGGKLLLLSGVEPEYEQWSLHQWHGPIWVYKNDGTLEIEHPPSRCEE
jgi:hypothetical protein